MLVWGRVVFVGAVAVLGGLVVVACTGDDGGSLTDGRSAPEGAANMSDRELFHHEVDGVRASVADCVVSESSSDGRRYRTTLEVVNTSTANQTVTVSVDAELGRGGVSDEYEIPMGAGDAWAVVSVEETTDPVGDVECADYITGVTVTLE